MQPLTTTHLMMTRLSMCPGGEPITLQQKINHIVFTAVNFVLNVIIFSACLAYCLKFFSGDFDGVAFGFMCVISEIGVIYFMIAAIRMRQQNKNIFMSLSAIHKNNENEMCFRYLARANNISEWMWTIYFKYIVVSIGGVAATSLLSVLYCYSTQRNFDVNHFYRPARLILPWNRETLLGYFAEVCFGSLTTYVYFIINGVALLFFISLCIHHRALYKMFKHKIGKRKKCDTKLLSDLIRFHMLAKDLFLASANVYSSFVLVQLICSTVTMTISVFYLDLQWHHFDFTAASVMVTSSIAMSTLLLYCYFGKSATESYAMMSDCVYEMDWYEQPNELQKYSILMIANIQKPIYYHGFYITNLDLRTFMQLCKSVISYYMVIKALAAK